MKKILSFPLVITLMLLAVCTSKAEGACHWLTIKIDRAINWFLLSR